MASVPPISVPTNPITVGVILIMDRLKAAYWAGMLPRNLSVVKGRFHSPVHTPDSPPTATLRGDCMKPTSAKRRASSPKVPRR